jgi:hypothetical protein
MEPGGRLTQREKSGSAGKHGQFALIWLKSLRAESPLNQKFPSAPAQSSRGFAVISSQKLRSFATRSAGGLPAIMAELTTPMEMPATQSG